jgi:hypothetical protein
MERAEEVKSTKVTQLGEFAELRQRSFESVEEVAHGIDAQQPQLCHELVAVSRSASKAECLARCVCLLCGEHSAQNARGVSVKRNVWWKRKEL